MTTPRLLEAAKRALALMEEVYHAHRDKDDPDYNECDNGQCAWCDGVDEFRVAVAEAERAAPSGEPFSPHYFGPGGSGAATGTNIPVRAQASGEPLSDAACDRAFAAAEHAVVDFNTAIIRDKGDQASTDKCITAARNLVRAIAAALGPQGEREHGRAGAMLQRHLSDDGINSAGASARDAGQASPIDGHAMGVASEPSPASPAVPEAPELKRLVDEYGAAACTLGHVTGDEAEQRTKKFVQETKTALLAAIHTAIAQARREERERGARGL